MRSDQKRFEHRMFELPEALEDFQPKVDALGEDGWEMVQIFQNVRSSGVWFKREKV